MADRLKKFVPRDVGACEFNRTLVDESVESLGKSVQMAQAPAYARDEDEQTDHQIAHESRHTAVPRRLEGEGQSENWADRSETIDGAGVEGVRSRAQAGV